MLSSTGSGAVKPSAPSVGGIATLSGSAALFEVGVASDASRSGFVVIAPRYEPGIATDRGLTPQESMGVNPSTGPMASRTVGDVDTPDDRAHTDRRCERGRLGYPRLRRYARP